MTTLHHTLDPNNSSPLTYSSAILDTSCITFSLASSFQISSGFSWVSGQRERNKTHVTPHPTPPLPPPNSPSAVAPPPPSPLTDPVQWLPPPLPPDRPSVGHVLSNMCTLASALSLMASMKMTGRNLQRTIRTLGPTSLSVIILAMREAVSSRTVGFCELQNRFSR